MSAGPQQESSILMLPTPGLLPVAETVTHPQPLPRFVQADDAYFDLLRRAGATTMVDLLSDPWYQICPPITDRLANAVFCYGVTRQTWAPIESVVAVIPPEVLENVSEARQRGFQQIGVYNLIRFGQFQSWAFGQRPINEGQTPPATYLVFGEKETLGLVI